LDIIHEILTFDEQLSKHSEMRISSVCWLRYWNPGIGEHIDDIEHLNSREW